MLEVALYKYSSIDLILLADFSFGIMLDLLKNSSSVVVVKNYSLEAWAFIRKPMGLWISLYVLIIPAQDA